MHYSSITLGKTEELLYTDLCLSNGITPQIDYITQRQVELILSMKNRLIPDRNKYGERVWKVIGKKKNGGNLTQRFARSFFMTDNF